MHKPEDAPAPFVNTSVARLMLARMRVTHEERGITVISGPWGVGKTSAIDAFASECPGECAVVKIEAAPTSRGLKTLAMLQLVIAAIKELNGRSPGGYSGTSPYLLKNELERLFVDWHYDHHGLDGPWPPTFTLIFDEAQFLAKESIELLRFWNDPDRCSMPFPVGLVFVGNEDFAMQVGEGGESVLSGAVRSRLLFEEPLSYKHLTDTDLTLFLQARGVEDAGALQEFVSYAKDPRVKRNLHVVNNKLKLCTRAAKGQPITGQIVRDILRPV